MLATRHSAQGRAQRQAPCGSVQERRADTAERTAETMLMNGAVVLMMKTEKGDIAVQVVAWEAEC